VSKPLYTPKQLREFIREFARAGQRSMRERAAKLADEIDPALAEKIRNLSLVDFERDIESEGLKK